MKAIKRLALVGFALAFAGGIAVVSTKLLSSAQAQITPAVCQCASTTLNLTGTTGSISNCQCGAMQCVALATSALQCK
jgi:hypothetical protein